MVDHNTSAVLSFLLCAVIAVGEFVMRNALASSHGGPMIAGALSSLVFVFLLTACSNYTMSNQGTSSKVGLTEVIFCFIVALSTAGMVHRVAVTTCFLISSALMFFLQEIAKNRYVLGYAPASAEKNAGGKKRK